MKTGYRLILRYVLVSFIDDKEILCTLVGQILIDIDTFRTFLSFIKEMNEVSYRCDLIGNTKVVYMIIKCNSYETAFALISQNGKLFNGKVETIFFMRYRCLLVGQQMRHTKN